MNSISHDRKNNNVASVLHTDMSKMVKARLREFAPAARGSQDMGSCNLAFAFFDISVCKTLATLLCFLVMKNQVYPCITTLLEQKQPQREV